MYKLFNRNRRKKGFTLIELIIVIAIIAILMAILIPNMVTYINEANSAVGEANARTVYSAASAAAAACIANNHADWVINIDETEYTAPPATPNNFKDYVNSLLGANFKGAYSVTVANGAVTSVTWAEGTGKTPHTYPQGTGTTTNP